MIALEWLRRPGEGEIFRFDRPEISLGLSPRNDLVLEGRGLLKKHCTIAEIASGGWQVTSMSGRDAVLVNGERCFRGPIHAGDRLQVGSVHLLFRGDPEHPEAPLPEPRPAPPVEVAAPEPQRPATPPPEEPESPDEGPMAVNSAGGLVFPERPDNDEPPKRGRRPIELAEIPTATPYGPLRREIQIVAARRAAFAEVARGILEVLQRRFRSAEICVFGREEGDSPVPLIAVPEGKLPVFSRKALTEMESRPRPLATREGERITTYFPLVGREGVVGFLVVRGSLGALDREFLEEIAFVLALLPGFPAGGSAAEDEEELQLTGIVGDDLKEIVEAVERRVIDRVMRRVRGNQSRGAAVLNISRGSLIAKIRAYAIPDYRSLRRR
jgi:hypothetical protein